MRRVLLAAVSNSDSSSFQEGRQEEEEGSMDEDDMEEIGVIIRSIKNDLTGIKVLLFSNSQFL
jgi:hypothetical protein